jgi:hypothetical protein
MKRTPGGKRIGDEAFLLAKDSQGGIAGTAFHKPDLQAGKCASGIKRE